MGIGNSNTDWYLLKNKVCQEGQGESKMGLTLSSHSMEST